jgi:hypothetical protein
MTSRLSWPTAAAGALCSILIGVARADVTLERSMSVEGVGIMAMGNMTGTTKTTISGDKARTDTDLQVKSRIVRMLTHNSLGPSAEIVRLDQDKIYHLNLNKKEYTEVSFEQMREQLKKASDQMNQADQKQQTPSVVDESQCEWLPATATVKKTGEKAQFAGYDAERLTITASQPCKDKKTGSICEVALGLDEWLTTSFTESAEAQKYYKAYATRMGLDSGAMLDVSQRAKAAFGRYQGIWNEVATKLQGVKGYPVKSSFTLALGGEQCQKAKEDQSGGSAGSGNSDSSGSGSVQDQIVGKLGSLFHKKKDDSDAAAQPAPQTTPPPVPPGDVALMTISSQLVSVSTNAASPETFEVPTGFKKQETKTQ